MSPFIKTNISVPALQADERSPALSEKARLHLDKYTFPVEMMVALPNGTIVNNATHDAPDRMSQMSLKCSHLQVHHINANFFLDQTSMKPDDGEEQDGTTFSFSGGFEDPSTSTYISFLKEGLERAKQYLEQ